MSDLHCLIYSQSYGCFVEDLGDVSEEDIDDLAARGLIEVSWRRRKPGYKISRKNPVLEYVKPIKAKVPANWDAWRAANNTYARTKQTGVSNGVVIRHVEPLEALHRAIASHAGPVKLRELMRTPRGAVEWAKSPENIRKAMIERLVQDGLIHYEKRKSLSRGRPTEIVWSIVEPVGMVKPQTVKPVQSPPKERLNVGDAVAWDDGAFPCEGVIERIVGKRAIMKSGAIVDLDQLHPCTPRTAMLGRVKTEREQNQ